jgi:hypothetical protein
VSWFGRFEEPVELPDGRRLRTLAEAMAGESDSEVRAQDGQNAERGPFRHAGGRAQR